MRKSDTPAFMVNFDQTQVVYHLGGGLTFDERGTKQVSVLNHEEKTGLYAYCGYLRQRLICSHFTRHSREIKPITSQEDGSEVR